MLSTTMAFVAADSDTILNSYNNAFYVSTGGNAYFKDTTAGGRTWFWGQANEIEMIADAYDRTGSAGHRDMLSALCNSFVANEGQLWTWNEYNDDIMWACIAFCRAHLATGNISFRDRAKANFDAVWTRAWSADLGGGLWWRTDNQTKNACVNGPAIIVACYLYQILGDASYLTKAQQMYTWERNTLFNATSGAVADGININGVVYWGWIFSYNQGTLAGAANALYNITGQRSYYRDALLATLHTKNAVCSNGIFPDYGDGDGSGFNGIAVRWIARFVQEQQLWAEFYPWLKANADAAWNVRRSDNLSWHRWLTSTASGTRGSFECFGSVTALQVIPPSNPASWFMLVNQHSAKCVDLIAGNMSDGAVVNQWSYDYNGANQRWSLVPDGAQLVASTYVSNNTAQQWDLVHTTNAWYQFRNVLSGKMLEVQGASTANNGKLQQFGSNTGTVQRWRLQPWGDYFIRTSNGKYVCIAGGGSTNGSTIIQYTKENNSWFKWRFETAAEGRLRIASLSALGRGTFMAFASGCR
ncbi:MAG: glycoside hydrolase family 76 protein, partial [Verrucomicrobiota bacterium]